VQIHDVLARALHDPGSFDSQDVREAPPAEESFPRLCVPRADPSGPDADEDVIRPRLGSRQVHELEAVCAAETFYRYRAHSTLLRNAGDILVPADALVQSGSSNTSRT
jgi:hypothetical protein